MTEPLWTSRHQVGVTASCSVRTLDHQRSGKDNLVFFVHSPRAKYIPVPFIEPFLNYTYISCTPWLLSSFDSYLLQENLPLASSLNAVCCCHVLKHAVCYLQRVRTCGSGIPHLLKHTDTHVCVLTCFFLPEKLLIVSSSFYLTLL